MDLKLRCSASGCECPNFGAAPSKETLRICDSCSHSWMTHLLEKLLTSRDDALSIFDVCSLALYGTHALPIRIKIVMERLLSTLQAEEVDKILRSFGWTIQDLARGYMMQDPRGPSSGTQTSPPPPTSSLFPNLNNNHTLMTRWTIIPRDEELLILQQFLRFPSTRSLSFSLLRDEFPMNLNGMTTPAPQFPPPPPPQQQLNPLKFNGLFGLGMNLIPGINLPKHEPPSPPPKPEPEFQKKRKDSPLNLAQNGSFESGVMDLSTEPPHHSPKPYNLRETSSHMHGLNLHPERKEEKHKSRSVRKWETSTSQQRLPPPQYQSIQPPPPPPPPPPPVNMAAAAVAASAAAAVNAAAVTAQQLVNPVTGKRRVQCAVCMKTFCDKGALKIHFSAVHLREMHKCTVSGCNMMFSSRRSRNRHSANPNPKLHSPHLRRKISPHDGRTAQPLLLQSPMMYGHAAAMAAMRTMPQPFANGFPTRQNNRKVSQDDKKKGMQSSNTSDSEQDFPVPIMMMNNSEDEDDSYMIHNPLLSEEEDDDGTGIHIPDEMMMVMPKGVKEDDSDSFSSTNEDKVMSPQKDTRKEGSRKRKLANPVRLPSVPDDSNDEFCCYDDGTEVKKEATSPPMLMSSNRSTSRTPELVPAAEEPDKKYNPQDEQYNLRKASRANMAEFDDEEYEDRSGNSSPTNSTSPIPIDRENPRRCLACAKVFQNHFGVKVHYQNVHLKLMHKCTVEGCNASFPSKRSRDRHSSNYNLHRKLLSTKSDTEEEELVENNSSINRNNSNLNTHHHSVVNTHLMDMLRSYSHGSALHQPLGPGALDSSPFDMFPSMLNSFHHQHMFNSAAPFECNICRLKGQRSVYDSPESLSSHMQTHIDD